MIDLTVTSAPKTSTFQVRINPEIKAYVEEIYAKSGLTLTDAFNLFLQQSINVQGLPFLVIADSKEILKQQAKERFLSEIEQGFTSGKTEGWIREEEIMEEFKIK